MAACIVVAVGAYCTLDKIEHTTGQGSLAAFRIEPDFYLSEAAQNYPKLVTSREGKEQGAQDRKSELYAAQE